MDDTATESETDSGLTRAVATAPSPGAPRDHAEPAILDVQAGLGETKAALLALGATAPQARSVAFEIDDHILLLAYDENEKGTTIAVGGPRAAETAHWLAHQFEDIGRAVGSVLPPLRRR